MFLEEAPWVMCKLSPLPAAAPAITTTAAAAAAIITTAAVAGDADVQ